MKNIVLVLVLVYLLRSTRSWYALEFRNDNTESDDDCNSVDVHIGQMKLGEFRDIDDCIRVVCGNRGILYLGCVEVEQSSNCTVVEGNSTAIYPFCCDVCKTNSSESLNV